MRHPTQPTHLHLVSDRESNLRPPANAIFGVALHDIIVETQPLQARLRVEELESINRRKDEILAMVSHELRSPLASIHTAVCVLGKQSGETPVRQKMQALIERQVRQMSRIVDDLLDVSRIASGSMQLRCERIDLRAVVSNAVEALEPNIKARQHRLSILLPDVPVWLHADACRLEQVFANLLANASRYTDAGGDVTVWVHTRDGQAVIRVRDSGIGIAPEALPRVFDLFKQANATDPRSTSGLGIGLAVVRNIVELHGGRVTAGSAGSGQGSEFTVRLPLEG